MRLIKLALALVTVSISWAAMANPAINSSVSGSIAGTVGAQVAGSVGTAAATQTQMVAGQAQTRLDRAALGVSGNDARTHSNSSSLAKSSLAKSSLSRSSSAGGMDESMPRGWLMALVTVLLIGHQLRRKHRFLRPQRFSDV